MMSSVFYPQSTATQFCSSTMWSGMGIVCRQHGNKSLIIPILKPGRPGTYRPISLTSCLCKLFERIVLDRLLYSIKPKFSNNFYGFISGRSIQQCIDRVLSGIRKRYNVFVDLKGAFDRGNPIMILSDLLKINSGTIIRIIQDYLTCRHSSTPPGNTWS